MRRLALLTAVLALGAASARSATGTYTTGTIDVSLLPGTTVASAVSVPDAGPVDHVSVSVRIAGTRAADLTLSLLGPDGTAVTLARARGGSGVGFGTGPSTCAGVPAVFDDRAEATVGAGAAPFTDQYAYRPDEPLAAFTGSDAKGRWRLRVDTAAGASPGTLGCWSLEIDRNVTETATASQGDVRATLTYQEANGFSRNARLQVVRAGARLLDVPVRRLTGSRFIRLLARDLDRDGEPEVLVELYTNGAHCCTVTLVYRYDPARHAYVGTARNWGDPGYRLADLDGDGRPEFVSADDRFAYEFTAFAASAFPTQVWHYGRSGFVDVTRLFPGVTRKDAASLWRGYLDLRKQQVDVRGVLAAWAADEEVLGRDADVWPALQAAYRRNELSPPRVSPGWPEGQAYIRALRAFLRKTGYRR